MTEALAPDLAPDLAPGPTGDAPGPDDAPPVPCRFCGAALGASLVDLGATPPANAYLTAAQLRQPETYYPLHALVCEHCFLVQLEAFHAPSEIFSDYRYFSSYSRSWLDHAGRFAAAAIERFGLDRHTLVVEVASNDGYLLKSFAGAGVPVLGIEPAANVAMVAQRHGIPTLVEFFGVDTARHLAEAGQQADLLVANNVLAHVPDINDFVKGLAITLKPEGVLSVEFPHLLRLLERNQFDTIYHEHFSYLSLLAVERIFAAHGLRVFDVEELPTHGGSLRVLAAPVPARRAERDGVLKVRRDEHRAGLGTIGTYRGFEAKVRQAQHTLTRFLIDCREKGQRVAGYGAPAKGNTLLNTAGIGPDLLPYTVDLSPHKQGLFLPGSHIPILTPDRIYQTKPDFVLILPWNLRDEISSQMAAIRDWGGKFVVPIPTLEIVP